MEQEVQSLFAQLNDVTLQWLPCFIDMPGNIHFRIGINDGPLIRFSKETDDLYYLYLKDFHGKDLHLGVSIHSPNFMTAQHIYQFIHTLNQNEDYCEMLNNPDQRIVLLTNLSNIINPVIKRLRRDL